MFKSRDTDPRRAVRVRPHRVHRSHLPPGRSHAGERRDARARAVRLMAREDPPVAALTVDEVVERASGAHRRRGSRPDALPREPRRRRRVHERRSRAHRRRRRRGSLGQLAVALRNRIEVDRVRRRAARASTRRRSHAPIFLTGLPRSGTTYFQYLFDQEPAPADAAHVGGRTAVAAARDSTPSRSAGGTRRASRTRG